MSSGQPIPNASSDAEELMSSLLDSLLDDFEHWFNRGEELLARCPTRVMASDDQQRLADRLLEGRQAIAATRALVSAASQPMAVSMDAMTPWHGLVTEVWSLAARLGSVEH